MRVPQGSSLTTTHAVAYEKLARRMEAVRDSLLEGVGRGFWSHGRTPEEQREFYKNIQLRVVTEGEHYDGVRLEWAYGGEGVCGTKSPSWNTPCGTSWQWRQRAS